jgi:hypothetical protein
MDLSFLNSPLAVLIVLVVGLALSLWMLGRVRDDAHGRQGARRPEDFLTELRAAYEAGQMDTAEFERVRRSLGADSAVAENGEPPRPAPSD